MALVRFGHVAIDWSLVYAAQILTFDATGRSPGQVALFADLPGVELGQAAAVVEGRAAGPLWQFIKLDARFTRVGNDRPFAYDESQVLAVLRTGEVTRVILELSGDRCATFDLAGSEGRQLIDSIPDSADLKM